MVSLDMVQKLAFRLDKVAPPSKRCPACRRMDGFSANNPVSAPGRAAEAAGWYAKLAARALLPDLMLRHGSESVIPA
jgi:hypothetical protein